MRPAFEDDLAPVRDQVQQQLGVQRPPAALVDPADVIRFAPDLPEEMNPEEARRLREQAERLHPWLQGPFYLGGGLVIGGAWRSDTRWDLIGTNLPADLTGTRVLDVGTNAGYDAFMFNLRGAEVVACEPYGFYRQAVFLNSVYRTPVHFRQIGWQDLDPNADGRFDLVHCNGVLYHELHPCLMLDKLRAMVAEGGQLILGSMILEKAELSEYARFVRGTYFGDETWWWVPGRLALRWMLEAAGFAVEKEFGTAPGPPGDFPVVTTYMAASIQ